MTHDPIQWKIDRLSQPDNAPRLLDLFSGCGGFSLGFHAAGFDLRGAVEFDPDAAASHAANFHAGSAAHAVSRDITATSPDALAADLDLGTPELAVDVIIGGPPCQAFARIGRAKLRSVRADGEFRNDPRAQLYEEYLRYVRRFQPLVIVMENVPDILNYGGRNVAEEIAHDLIGQGYEVRYTLLNAVHYGVPQMRKRMFLLAYHQRLETPVVFPPPTRSHLLPEGYRDRVSRIGMLRQRDLFQNSGHYMDPPAVPESDLLPAVTVGEALRDLPPFRGSDSRAQVDEQSYPYTGESPSSYALEMRQWLRTTLESGARRHITRYLKRDWRIFEAMPEGALYPRAHELAIELFHKELARLGEGAPREGTDEYAVIRKAYVPPYPVDSFSNKWQKLQRNQPSHTLQAHLSKDGYSHIHYDSSQARTITVREAARLQSFPDAFLFHGSMGAAFRQIGNAVPPLMSRALATTIRDTLMAAVRRQADVVAAD
ncbi:DNA cytosine methyltransferase [Deinococcus hopiensis]|uniref:DNA (cytosine-5-)-methyltransferase n=1 Tax=Deinococcus hopiensis KR-140 TaxID=695939 RepID=A0A1W1UM80_9DEIO|nr:DNA cytosine methyltransferase [Deinococcus hopiensis]SMB82170.1 DNA (cytosine-5)-methyltransferase 1 [Deinococcus hopiensis KR-140]